MGLTDSRSDANRKNYAATLEELQKKRRSNASQRKVLKAASKMNDWIFAVESPLVQAKLGLFETKSLP